MRCWSIMINSFKRESRALRKTTGRDDGRPGPDGLRAAISDEVGLPKRSHVIDGRVIGPFAQKYVLSIARVTRQIVERSEEHTSELQSQP